MTAERKRWVVSWVVGLLSLSLGLYTSLGLLEGNDWNPSIFIKFPEANPEQLAYGERMLGEIIPAGGQGHDGKYFFMQANDPFYLEPGEHARFLDRPSYRAQRMLYPAVAGGMGVLSPDAIAWSLWGVNMALVFVGGFLTARLATALGVSPWFGLAFTLNPGVITSWVIDTADVMAMVLFVWSVLMVVQKRYVAAALVLTLAGLTRETMLLGAIGAGVYLWRIDRKVPVIMGLPFAASAAWWLYLRSRIGHLDESLQDTQAIGVPFQGFMEAFDRWLIYPNTENHMLFGLVLMTASLLVVRRVVRSPSALGYMTAGFVLIAVTMVADVWKFYFDASRALVPLVTAYVIMVPADQRQRPPDLTPDSSDLVAPVSV